MNVRFLDLHKQYTEIKNEIDGAIKKVVDSQFFILGNELKLFEKEFATYLGSKYIVGVGNGTEALILALRALNIHKGDEVITQPNSFIATTLAITEVGATPVFVDIDSDTYQINVDQIESKITKKTKAILPVHLFGAPCEIKKIVDLAKKHNLYVIEDACQSHGATLDGKMTGTFGDIGVFSFYPSKNLGAYGDGGALSTNNQDLYKKLIKLRNYGEVKKYYHETIGINSRLDELQAAILRVKLRHLNKWNRKRNIIAKKYIKGLPNIKTQKIFANSTSNYYIFVIEVENRDKISVYLKKHGIETLIHYPIPIHLQKCYSYLGYKINSLPVTEKISGKIISLPIYPEITDQEITYICRLINNYYFEKN